MDRDSALQAARERYEIPMWRLLTQLEDTLGDFSRIRHIEPTDLRAVGSTLNAALANAADAASISDHGLEINYCRNGQSNKMSGSIQVGGDAYKVSLELHLCGPQGGTSKSAHQFAGYDVESEPTFPGFEVEAPPDILLFVACHLAPTGASISRAFLKFADGMDQRKIEIHRHSTDSAIGFVAESPVDGPAGAKITLKKPKGEEEQDGSKTAKRRHAASRSKET